MVSAIERRDTIDQSPLNLQHQRSFEQYNDQTWQGRLIYGVLSIFRVLERQSYLLSLIAMLVNNRFG